ncbi:hypothetical protein HDU98_004838 [Podochytrium sp. JEL0797]|nr:hypothetical protein HDU98_004838 [Podochytrium sp. JEL0797]
MSVSRVISFANEDSRVNVYYTTGTVGTCMDHPIRGKTQLFRRDCSLADLAAIFADVRVHTGKGYYRRSQMVHVDVAYDEQTAWKQHQQYLQAEMDIVNDQLRKFDELKKAEEAKEAERVRAEQARRAEIERANQIASERAAQAARSRILNARGNNYDYALQYHGNFPPTMKDVVCVAIADGGYAAIYESSSCGYHGIPTEVAGLLDKQHLQNLRYLALGQGGQYYLAKTNGRGFFSGSTVFCEKMKSANKLVRWVSFGEFGQVFVQFDDGSSWWDGDDIPYLVGEVNVDFLWMDGPAYIIGYNGTWKMEGTPSWLPDRLIRLFQRQSIKQILIDNDTETFFVRYS